MARIQKARTFGDKVIEFVRIHDFDAYATQGAKLFETTVKSINDGADVKLYIVKPLEKQKRKRRLVLFLHGGGFVFGNARMMNLYAGDSMYYNAVVVSVEYRLAPEHQHPKGVEDCVSGLIWAVENAQDLEADVNRLIITGQSAGGYYTASVAQLWSKMNRTPMPMMIIPIIPMIAPIITKSHWENFDQYLLPTKENLWFWHMATDNITACVFNSVCNPLAKQNTKPVAKHAIVIVGEKDCLRDEGIQYHELLLRNSVASQLLRLPGTHTGSLIFFREGSYKRHHLKVVEMLNNIDPE